MAMLDKTLITGANGMVGNYFDFGIKTDRNDLDITNSVQVQEFFEKNRPEVVIHLAAETDLTKCEADPAHAYLVNASGTYNLAVASRAFGAKMVYVSTDSVFPNSSTPSEVGKTEKPDSIYGHSKYLGELAVKGILEDYIIARTSWIFGGGPAKDKKFVAKFIKELEKPTAKAVNDQRNSPTFAKDLVGALKTLVLDGKKGTFHIVNSGSLPQGASRYDMALTLARILNKDTNIEAVSASVFNVPFYLQSSGGLIPSVTLRSWQDALKEYLETEWKN